MDCTCRHDFNPQVALSGLDVQGGRVWGTAATYCGEAWEGPSRAGKTMARTWHRAANVKWTAGRTKTTHSTLCQRASRSAGRTASPIWIRNAKEAWMGSTPAALPRTAAAAIGRPVAKGTGKEKAAMGERTGGRVFKAPATLPTTTAAVSRKARLSGAASGKRYAAWCSSRIQENFWCTKAIQESRCCGNPKSGLCRHVLQWTRLPARVPARISTAKSARRASNAAGAAYMAPRWCEIWEPTCRSRAKSGCGWNRKFRSRAQRSTSCSQGTESWANRKSGRSWLFAAWAKATSLGRASRAYFVARPRHSRTCGSKDTIPGLQCTYRSFHADFQTGTCS